MNFSSVELDGIRKSQLESLEQLRALGNSQPTGCATSVIKQFHDTRSRAIAKCAPDFRPDGGYTEGMGAFLKDVYSYAIEKSLPDGLKQYEHNYSESSKKLPPMLRKATGMNETIMGDGGALVPTEFLYEVLMNTYNSSVVLAGLRTLPLNTNSIKVPTVNETSRVDGSRWGGARGYWSAEGGTLTGSKPSTKTVNMQLNKAYVVCYATDELIEDSPIAIEGFINPIMTEELAFTLASAVIRGDNVGKPMGMISSQNPALVVQAIESAQAANTVNAQNIVKMWSRLPVGMQQRSVWYYNQQIIPQLLTLTFGSTTAGWPVYMPPGGMSASPYATILGRPAYAIEFASALSAQGDIMLVVPDQYLWATKGGINAATSMHVQFLTDEMCFRWTVRVDGKPWWLSALTPYQGSTTQSPFVTLAVRP